MKKFARSKFSLEDGRFKLVEYATVLDEKGKPKSKIRNVRYPQVQILKNRIRVGCTTITREAALKLIGFGNEGCGIGYVQGESQV